MKAIGLLSLIALIVAFVVFSPFLVIWTINVFGDTFWPQYRLPYSWETWLASLLFITVLKPDIKVKLKD